MTLIVEKIAPPKAPRLLPRAERRRIAHQRREIAAWRYFPRIRLGAWNGQIVVAYP